MFWNRHENLKTIIFAIMTVLIIVMIIQMKNIALLAFGSFVLSCSLNPAVDKLCKFKNMSRGLAATIVILSTIFAVLIFFIPLSVKAIEEIRQLVANVPELINNIMNFLNHKIIMGRPIIDYINLQTVSESSSEFAGEFVNKSLDFTVSVFGGITVLVTMGVIVFYLLCEKNLLRDAVIKMFPHRMKEKAKEVYENIERKVGGYVIAQIVLMSAVAVFTALGLAVCRVNYAVLIGLIAGIFDIVPIVGPCVAFLIGIFCAAQQGWIFVALTALVFLLVQWGENNFLRPYIFGKFLNLHPIIIIFAFLIAGQLIGVWGVILSPAIAAMIVTLFDELYLKIINRQAVEEKNE